MTFLVIGIMWVNHHSCSTGSRCVTRALMFLNMLLLMAIAFLPFPTALLAEYLREDANSHIATAVYSATMDAIGLGFVAMWWYLSHHPEHGRGAPTPPMARSSMRRALAGPVVYGATILLAYVGAPACLVVYARWRCTSCSGG